MKNIKGRHSSSWWEGTSISSAQLSIGSSIKNKKGRCSSSSGEGTSISSAQLSVGSSMKKKKGRHSSSSGEGTSISSAQLSVGSSMKKKKGRHSSSSGEGTSISSAQLSVGSSMKKKKGRHSSSSEEGTTISSAQLSIGSSMKNKKGRRSKPSAVSVLSLDMLPDEVLLNILEKLEDTRHAVRICTLSKQMHKLYTMLSQLVIYIGPIARHHDEYGHHDLNRVNRTIVDATEKVLSTRSPGMSIHKISVKILLKHVDFFSVCRSFAGAMATHKVGEAEFDILTEKSYKNCTTEDLMNFGKLFNTSLAAFPDVFAGLTRLRLENMRFGQQDIIPNILCTCKQLESLRFSKCDPWAHSVLRLKHAKLVELEIDRGRFDRVELTCLPKLQRLRYDTCRCPYGDHSLSFGFTPQLSKLSLGKTALDRNKIFRLSELFSNVPSISDLHLDFRSQKIWVQPECPKLLAPVFGKLRHVNLDNLPEGCDVAWTMFILEAAPSLEELCITVWNHWCDPEEHGYWQRSDLEWEPSASDLKHKNLAKLTIHGFQPNEKLVRYVRRVMVAAVNMVEISLHDRKACDLCKDKIKMSMEMVSLHYSNWRTLCRRCKKKMKLSIEDEWKLCKRCMDNIKFCPLRFPQTWWEEYLLRKEIRKGLGMASPAVISFSHGISLN